MAEVRCQPSCFMYEQRICLPFSHTELSRSWKKMKIIYLNSVCMNHRKKKGYWGRSSPLSLLLVLKTEQIQIKLKAKTSQGWPPPSSLRFSSSFRILSFFTREWSGTGTVFLGQWSLHQAGVQEASGQCSDRWSDFWVALCGERSWTWWSLSIPSNNTLWC